MLIKGQISSSVSQNSTNVSAGEAAVVQMPKSLKLGKTIQGQVVSINGNEIELLLQDKAKISAKIDSEMQVSLNQILNFEVKKTSTSVMLRPLFENLAGDANATKALQAANMQINGDNLKMVSNLMERGLPVDKSSLQEMSRFISTNQSATGDVLVEMKEFQIPITNENINEFVAYKGMNHYLTDSISDLSTSLNQGIQTLAEDNQPNVIRSVISDLSQLFQSKASSQSVESSFVESMNVSEVSEENVEGHILNDNQKLVASENKVTENYNISNMDKQEVQVKLQNIIENLKLPESIQNELQMSKGDLTKTFQVVESLLQNEQVNVDINEFVKLEPFQKAVQILLEEGIYLKPEEFADKEAVKEVYKSMKHQIDSLLDVSEQMGKAGEELSSTAKSLQNNLDFINQINQTFNYIQIPLKDGEQSGKGELFVYAKKQASLEQGESVSALLHLDMRNLGSMDVRVQMTNEKVQTNFFLEDEQTLDFISEHLPELDKAIERRGYQVQSVASINDNHKDTIEKLIEEEESNGAILVSNHSFDARA